MDNIPEIKDKTLKNLEEGIKLQVKTFFLYIVYGIF
jgi:hypothetical protein